MRSWERLVRAGTGVASAWALGGCSAQAGPWLLGSLALVLAAGVGLGWLLAQLRSRAELHAARQRARLLPALAGASVWRGDAQGRLAPEAGVDAAAGGMAGDAIAAALARVTGLQDALRRPTPLPATMLAGPDAAVLLEWRSAPCFDAQGRFDGHLGLVRPLPTNALADAALAALAAGWPGPLLVLARSADAEPWRVAQASPAALAAFGTGPTLNDADVAAALPAGLRAGWSEAAAEAEGWQSRRLEAAGQQLALLWQSEGGQTSEQASLSYSVSHDLRAPIRVVEGFTRIVKEDYGRQLDRIANDHLDRVLGAAARMNQMIDAMLTLARLSSQPLARQPVNLTQLAGFVLDDLRRAAPERDASVSIEPGMQARGDPTLLRLVLENLLGNAWKYSARRAQTRIEFGRETVDGRSVYVVRDNGAGFDMRSVDRLFGLFQRLHSASDFPGTGVGLASVRRIVQRHGGEIWADGEPGRGAAFFFTLRDG